MFVHDVGMHCKVKQTKPNLQKYFHPSSLNHLTVYTVCACMYNAVSQKRSAKGYNFKEDDIYSL